MFAWPTSRKKSKPPRADNATLRVQLATERAAREALLAAHEATLVRLTTELAILQRRIFGQKAERLHNEGAQRPFMDLLKELGLFKEGDVQAGERAAALASDLHDEADHPADGDAPEPDSKPETPKGKKRKSTPHGRRKPEDSNVPVECIVIEPLERAEMRWCGLARRPCPTWIRRIQKILMTPDGKLMRQPLISETQ